MVLQGQTFRFEDISQVCVDCGKQFILEGGEQSFFASKDMPFPKRCRPCRLVRKQTINTVQGVK